MGNHHGLVRKTRKTKNNLGNKKPGDRGVSKGVVVVEDLINLAQEESRVLFGKKLTLLKE